MKLPRDDRAASTVIGFVILFGVLVMMVTIWQVQVIPSQNAEVEYNHYQEVRTDLVELRSGILDAPGRGQPQTVSIVMGTEYPERTLYVNPAPVYGTIETVNASGSPFSIRVENASAADGARQGVDQRWNGTDRIFSTAALVYEPTYHELDYDPTFVYEHSVLHEAGGDDEPIAGQSIVDGRDVSLVALRGAHTASSTESVDVVASPHGADVRSVEVSNGSSPVVLEVPTRRSQAAWNRSLRAELSANGGNVMNVTVDQSALSDPWGVARIRLAPGVRYNLQLAAVTVGERAVTPDSPTRYLTPTEGDGATTAVGETTRLVVEARNQYDNPLANRTITFDTDLGRLRADGVENGTVTVRTDRRGRATVRHVSNDSGTATVTASVPDEAGVDPASLTVNVGSGSNGSSGGLYGVQWLQDSYRVTVGGNYTLTAITTEPVSDVPVSFAVENRTVAQNVSADRVINQSGANFTIAIGEQPPGGNASNVYVSTLSGGDSAALLVGESQFDVTITGSNSPIEQGDTAVVDARIVNTGTRGDSQQIDLLISGSVVDSTTVTLAPGENASVSLEWATSSFTPTGDYTAVVSSDDANDTTTVTVESNGIPGFELAAVLLAVLAVAATRWYRTRDGESSDGR